MLLVAVLCALPQKTSAQQADADFEITGIIEGCSSVPSMLVVASDKNGGAFYAGMLSPLVGHEHGSLVVYHVDSQLNVVIQNWFLPNQFTSNPVDIVVDGDKVIVLVRALTQGSSTVATMVFDKETLVYLGGTWYPNHYEVTPKRFVSMSQVIVNNGGVGELWDITQPDPDPRFLGEEIIFSANLLDASGFTTLSYESVRTFDLDGIEQSHSMLSESYTPWGIGVTSGSTIEAYTQSSGAKRVVVDYYSGQTYEYQWEENHISFAFGQTRIGLVAEEPFGTSLIGNHTEVWCGSDVYDIKDYILQIQSGSWVVYFEDADYDLQNGLVWLTGRTHEIGGTQRFSWYGKVPISESPLEGIPSTTGISEDDLRSDLIQNFEVYDLKGSMISSFRTNQHGLPANLEGLPYGAYLLVNQTSKTSKMFHLK